MTVRNVGNLDIARGPGGTVELRVRHVSTVLHPASLSLPPTLVVLGDDEVRKLIGLLQDTLKEKPPAKRPAPPADDFDDIA